MEVAMSDATLRPKGEPMLNNRLEIIARLPAKPRLAPPILFVHGAWHGAWCWDDHFLDYFADLGFASYALNLRGHGASRGTRDVRFCRIRHFVEDLSEAVDLIGSKPILVGHSMGGFVVQKYLEKTPAELGVLLASVPPDGASRMLKRLRKSQPLDLLVSNLIFSLRPLFSTNKKVRNALFTSSTPEEIVEKCAKRLQDDVIIGFLDYLFLNLVDPSKIKTKMLVFGAGEDHMIHDVDLKVTGCAYGEEPVIIPGLGHDLMIDRGWETAAGAIARKIDDHLGVKSEPAARLVDVA
jgi:pimeloyl-ACP methyl ester carboxylesterase